MATKEHLDFFRELYGEENARYADLESRAKFYIGVVAIFLATLLFKVKEVRESAALLEIPWWMLLLEMLCLAVAVLLVVLGATIREYEGIADPEQLIDDYEDEWPDNEQFFEDRIADYVVATNRNRDTNNRAANYLQGAGLGLVAAMAIIVAMIVVALYR